MVSAQLFRMCQILFFLHKKNLVDADGRFRSLNCLKALKRRITGYETYIRLFFTQ